MSFNDMSFDKMSFDNMSFDEMSFDEMSFDKMSSDEMSPPFVRVRLGPVNQSEVVVENSNHLSVAQDDVLSYRRLNLAEKQKDLTLKPK